MISVWVLLKVLLVIGFGIVPRSGIVDSRYDLESFRSEVLRLDLLGHLASDFGLFR